MRKTILAALAMLGICVALVFAFIQYDNRPIVFDSYGAWVKTGKRVCVFVDHERQSKPCSAFSEAERAKMEHEWAF